MIAQRHAATHRVRRSLWLVRARTSSSDAANGATRFRCCTANRLRSAPAAIEARPFDRRTRRHDLHARRYGVFVPTNVRRCEPRLSQDDYRWCERLGARRMVLSCALNSPRLIASACRDKAAPLHHQQHAIARSAIRARSRRINLATRRYSCCHWIMHRVRVAIHRWGWAVAALIALTAVTELRPQPPRLQPMPAQYTVLDHVPLRRAMLGSETGTATPGRAPTLTVRGERPYYFGHSVGGIPPLPPWLEPHHGLIRSRHFTASSMAARSRSRTRP